MSDFYQDLLLLQQSLVYASLAVAALGLVLIGFGFVVSGVSLEFGYRLRRLGLQTVGAVLITLIIHTISVEIYGGRVPLAFLLAFYGFIGLMLLHGFLNLFFGPNVGNGVISRLLGALILFILALGFASYSGLLNFGP